MEGLATKNANTYPRMKTMVSLHKIETMHLTLSCFIFKTRINWPVKIQPIWACSGVAQISTCSVVTLTPNRLLTAQLSNFKSYASYSCFRGLKEQNYIDNCRESLS